MRWSKATLRQSSPMPRASGPRYRRSEGLLRRSTVTLSRSRPALRPSDPPFGRSTASMARRTVVLGVRTAPRAESAAVLRQGRRFRPGCNGLASHAPVGHVASTRPLRATPLRHHSLSASATIRAIPLSICGLARSTSRAAARARVAGRMCADGPPIRALPTGSQRSRPRERGALSGHPDRSTAAERRAAAHPRPLDASSALRSRHQGGGRCQKPAALSRPECQTSRSGRRATARPRWVGTWSASRHGEPSAGMGA
jgi:hypothetical protein